MKLSQKKVVKKKLFNECCKIWHMLKNDGGAKTCLRENLQEISKNTGDVVVCSLCGCLGDFHESRYLKPTIASKIVEILLCETRPFSFFTVIVVAWLVRRLSSKNGLWKLDRILVVENLCTPFRELVWSERKIWGLSERKPLCALILVLRDVFEVRVTNFKNQENFVENGNLARFVRNLHLYLPCWSFHFSWSLFLFLYCFCSYRYINFYLLSALFPRNVRIFHKVFSQRKNEYTITV